MNEELEKLLGLLEARDGCLGKEQIPHLLRVSELVNSDYDAEVAKFKAGGSRRDLDKAARRNRGYLKRFKALRNRTGKRDADA